jgi:hypothetical protein
MGRNAGAKHSETRALANTNPREKEMLDSAGWFR